MDIGHLDSPHFRVRSPGLNIAGWFHLVCKNLSSFNLNSSMEHLVMFQTLAGLELKSWGPLPWQVCCLNDCADFFAFLFIGVISHFLPLLSSSCILLSASIYPNIFEYIQMDPNVFKWIQMDPNGSKWMQIHANGSKWIQMDTNGY